jgi:hypothetical protein
MFTDANASIPSSQSMDLRGKEMMNNKEMFQVMTNDDDVDCE